MIYTVVCTDLNDYINWQFELLEYSWSRVNQPGKLIRLVSCEDDVALPEHRHAQVYRTKPSNVHPTSGDVYVCYNRLYSLQQWLDEQDIDGTVLIVDADVVFRKPLKTEVSSGSPIGQHWLDYGLSEDFKSAVESASAVPVDKLQAVTWPALIHSQDLQKLMPRWIEITVTIREQLKRQESDMFAFLAAAQEQNLEFELGTTTAFMPWPDEKVQGAPIIHYCQIVEALDGSELWAKGRYQPWNRVAGAQTAKLPYCRDLVELVDEFARIKNHQKLHKDKTIFIALASYCEPELVDTINSCLEKARNPENLRFGICHQFDNSDPLIDENCLDQFSQDKRFRYVVYDHKDSEGGCWARNIAQQLYLDENYTLQIDTHTQMVESWDTILIEMMDSLPSQKPLITQFPPLYTIDDGNYDFHHIDDLSQVNSGVAVEWHQDGWLHHTQKLIPENNTHFPRQTRFLSGAFVFTLGQWVKDVMQDDKHFYTGEEYALALRSYTHGYDLFDPNQIVAWHRGHPQANRKYWNDDAHKDSAEKHNIGVRRLRLLTDGDPDNELGQFGLGKERTLDDYYQFSGIDCINKTISDAAKNGEPIAVPTQAEGVMSFQSGSVLINRPDLQNQQLNTHQNPLVSNRIIDLTIHRTESPPLLLSCEENNPILVTLFTALRQKVTQPDDVIYLDLGGGLNERVLFKQSQLVSIETTPSLSAEFFQSLPKVAMQVPMQAQQQVQHQQVQQVSVGTFNDEWKFWIWSNINNGVSKDLIFKQLLEHGYTWQAAQLELSHQPTIPLDQIQVAAASTDNIVTNYVPSPVAQRLDVEGIEFYQVDNFLNAKECAELADVIHSKLVASRTVGLDDSFTGRTSQTCFFDFNKKESAFALEVSQRVSKLIGINPNYAEAIQAHVYNPGQEYAAHHDWFDPSSPEFQVNASDALGGQRTWSVLVYLNKVEEGGNTDFPNVNFTVEPNMGKLVFWNNLNSDKSPNYNTLHQACPVVAGQKVVLTMWYRSLAEGPMYMHEAPSTIPRYTEKGIAMRSMSENLFKKLTNIVRESSDKQIHNEFVEGGFLQSETDDVPSSLIDIPEQTRQQIAAELLPICEDWSQQKLQLASIYGIRVYARGTSLKMHTDTSDTHHISAILNIAQKIDSDWPLEIDDHMFRRHSINLNVGDVLLYEGARLSHGRPSPFNGDMYANIFIHFHPV